MENRTFSLRFLIASILIGLVFLALLVRFAFLMLGNQESTPSTQVQPIERGPILDRRGRLLAVQNTVFRLEVWRPAVVDQGLTAQILGPLLELDQMYVQERLAISEGSVVLKRNLNQSQADAIQAAIDQNSLKGVTLFKESARSYPHGSQGAHIIGFTGVDNNGLEGIELAFNSELNGNGIASSDGTVYGNQVVLTLDLDIQNFLEDLAKRTMENDKPDGLVFVVAEGKTGEILGMVNRPAYDLNDYRQSTPEMRRNRAISFIYEPGSVFKVFTMAGIMNQGTIDGNTIFKTAGGYRSPLFRDPISDLSNYGDITVEGIITYSSNVGAALAAETISNASFSGLLSSFGFGARTGIELAGEERGIIKAPEQWSARTKPTMAFGQEIGVTAMQMVQAATSLANQGTMVRPHLVKSIISPQGDVLQDMAPTAVAKVLEPSIAKAMLQYMNSATEEGTATRSRIQGMNISVKTGTSQMIDEATGAYSAEAFIASSLALFPTEDPQIVVYMVIFHPRGQSIYGGRIVAPLIKEAAEYLVPLLGLPREGDVTHVQGREIQIRVPTLPSLNTQVPDFTGLPLRTLMPLLSQRRYKVTLQGSGWVVSQSPAPGTELVDGMTIQIRLSEQPNGNP